MGITSPRCLYALTQYEISSIGLLLPGLGIPQQFSVSNRIGTYGTSWVGCRSYCFLIAVVTWVVESPLATSFAPDYVFVLNDVLTLLITCLNKKLHQIA